MLETLEFKYEQASNLYSVLFKLPEWSFKQEYELDENYIGGKSKIVMSESSPYHWTYGIYEDDDEFSVEEGGKNKS